jgi:hypothetical protein
MTLPPLPPGWPASWRTADSTAVPTHHPPARRSVRKNDRRNNAPRGGPPPGDQRDRLIAVLNIAAACASHTLTASSRASHTDGRGPLDPWTPLRVGVAVAHDVAREIIAERGKRSPEAEWRLQDAIRALSVERTWAEHELGGASDPPKSWCERYAANAGWGIALLATLRDAPAAWLRLLRLCRRGSDCPAPLFVSGPGSDTAYCSAPCRTGHTRSRRRTDRDASKRAQKSPRHRTSQ